MKGKIGKERVGGGRKGIGRKGWVGRERKVWEGKGNLEKDCEGKRKAGKRQAGSGTESLKIKGHCG